MKIYKKRALELACWEQELRNGTNLPYEKNPLWTWKDECEQEGYQHWIDTPESMIATMAYDGYFHGANLKKLKKFLGEKLYYAALEAYFVGDHDT